MSLKENVKKFLQEIEIIDLVKNLQIIGNDVFIDVFSKSAALHEKKKLEAAIKVAFSNHFGEDINLKLKIIAPENTNQETKNLSKRKQIAGIKNIILIASGKGGVGKSTVASNIAVTLKNMGYNVGLLDADAHGPSIPTMFNSNDEKPITTNENGKDFIKPVESYGIKHLSIGHFSSNDQAIVWRGPMASRAITQMLNDAYWGELDFLLIDLPPGTSDIHLSILQEVDVTGVVIVSTPQLVALNDVQRGISMFQMDGIKAPILGIIENMAYFSPQDNPDKKYYIFGKDGAKNISKDLEIPFLGEIPIIEDIRKGGDEGKPSVLNTKNQEYYVYIEVTQNILTNIERFLSI